MIITVEALLPNCTAEPAAGKWVLKLIRLCSKKSIKYLADETLQVLSDSIDIMTVPLGAYTQYFLLNSCLRKPLPPENRWWAWREKCAFGSLTYMCNMKNTSESLNVSRF